MEQLLRDSTTRNHHGVVSFLPSKQLCADLETYGAYNETRGHLLSSHVDLVDFSFTRFNDRIAALTANSGAGLWLVPFRGISVVSEQTPLDLIYLDVNSVVLDIVESFPISRISEASPPAASVLALPSETIRWTQTQRGDQLLLCAAEEFNRRLSQLTGSIRHSGAALKGQSSWDLSESSSGSGNRLQSNDCSMQTDPDKDTPPMAPPTTWESRRDVLNDPKRKKSKPAKNWLQRLWSPDPPEPRHSPRESFTSVFAHFWTGGAPIEHKVRNISQTGLYVVTGERWFLGSQVRMTLTDSGDPNVENSLTANTSVVRWGNDGVGLKFVMEDVKSLRRGQTPQINGTNKKELSRFLQLARNGNRENGTRDTETLNTVAVGGHAGPDCNDLFIGPISSSLLIDSLKDVSHPVSAVGASPWLNLSNASRPHLQSIVSSTESKRKPRILLIDDEYLDLVFLAGTLEDIYEVAFATDGATALESANRIVPDLILLDVMMPGIDGFEVCRQLKAAPPTKDIPVIFITGLSEVAAETKGLQLGAVDYIRKPFHAAPLRVKVNAQINLRMAQRSH